MTPILLILLALWVVWFGYAEIQRAKKRRVERGDQKSPGTMVERTKHRQRVVAYVALGALAIGGLASFAGMR